MGFQDGIEKPLAGKNIKTCHMALDSDANEQLIMLGNRGEPLHHIWKWPLQDASMKTRPSDTTIVKQPNGKGRV